MSLAGEDETPYISLVIPTMNEEEGIGECIDRAKNAFDELGVKGEIIVSDSSDDRTPEIAREKGARVVNPDRKGYGYAYRYAFERARGELLAMGDGDTTYDFEELPKLVSLIEDGADMAMGSRLEGEIKPGSMPRLHKYVGNPLLTKFLNVFYGAGISDSHSGFRVFTREAYEKMDLETDGMEFASEMVMEAGANDLSIAETPITYHARVGDATLHSFRDGWRHVKFMLVNAPGYLFTVPGLGLGILGLAVMLASFLNLSPGGQELGSNSMIAGSLLTLLGYQISVLAVFTSFAADPIKEASHLTRWVKNWFRLERGILSGLSVLVAGKLYALYLVYQWYISGFSNIPSVQEGLLASTA
ncbi:MAG: glycosyltransferase family 2 protein, partial [Candidatus Nanohaloarchaea archaeon]